MLNKGEGREGPLILIVDDDRMIVSFLSRALAESGYRSLTACDGNEAMERMREQAPAALMLDLTMPGPSAGSVVRFAREVRPGMPVIVLSGLSEGAAVALLPGTEPDIVLRKPVRISILLEKLASVRVVPA